MTENSQWEDRLKIERQALFCLCNEWMSSHKVSPSDAILLTFELVIEASGQFGLNFKELRKWINDTLKECEENYCAMQKVRQRNRVD